jgi:hypothetical protein
MEEIRNMDSRFKVMSLLTQHRKEEIKTKDMSMLRERLKVQDEQKKIGELRNEVNRIAHLTDNANATLKNQQMELQKLKHILEEADLEKRKQRKELDVVVHERDILQAQLIMRNDELTQLYEKILIQQSTLNMGERQYKCKLEEIRTLRLRINELRQEHGILKNNTSHITELRNAVLLLQKQLLNERIRVKALSEELSHKMNVHRWRILEGSNKEVVDMIRKVQLLQKRLIAKTEEGVEKDLLIQEKEKLYVELKNILARQPGPEVAEQLGLYQNNLKDKCRQMKAMDSELKMYRMQVKDLTDDTGTIKLQINELKAEWFELKKVERRQMEREMLEGSAGSMDSQL